MHSIQRAAFILLSALTALQLNAEVRFTGANPEQDEKLFRQAITIITRADPTNRVLSLEEMEDIVHLEFAYDNFNFGVYTYFSDRNNPTISLIPPEEGHDKKDIAVTLAHEGKHFFNHNAFPFKAAEDMFPLSLGLIFQAIDEGSSFYNSIKVAKVSSGNRLRPAPTEKPSFEHLSPEYTFNYISGAHINSMGVDLKRWMSEQEEYKTLPATDFEKEFKREFFKVYLECALYPMLANDNAWYTVEEPVIPADSGELILALPAWVNPEFAYLQEKDNRNLLIARAIEACFGDIGITPEECDEIFNKTLARIEACRESKGLPTMRQIEHRYHEYLIIANNPQWLEERGLSRVIIAPPYLENSQEAIEAILNRMPVSN